MNTFIVTITLIFISVFQLQAQDQVETLSNGKKNNFTFKLYLGISKSNKI